MCICGCHRHAIGDWMALCSPTYLPTCVHVFWKGGFGGKPGEMEGWRRDFQNLSLKLFILYTF